MDARTQHGNASGKKRIATGEWSSSRSRAVITKRAAWPDARGRIFLEVDGRVIILADECAAAAGDRVTCKGLARAALEGGDIEYYGGGGGHGLR